MAGSAASRTASASLPPPPAENGADEAEAAAAAAAPTDAALLANCLRHTTEGLCRPLQVRVEQVLAAAAAAGLVGAFRLCSLLQFYAHTLGGGPGPGLLPADAPLSVLLGDLYTLARKVLASFLFSSPPLAVSHPPGLGFVVLPGLARADFL